MKLKTYRHLWGVNDPFEYVFPRIRELGYDGVEFKGIHVAESPALQQLIREYDFEFITQIHTEGESVDDHFASFRRLIELSLPLKPVLINSQSGRDRWSLEEKKEFLGRALEYEQATGIPVAHETHRSRMTYNPWDTRDLLLSFRELKLCCDFSHWVCVCERLIDSEREIIELCASRCLHVHARVGYEQGPQVPDPRAPEYEGHLEAHESWWEIVWRKQAENGFRNSTLTPEFGPPAYQQTLPFSRVPVSNLAEICDWMQQREKSRFSHLFPG